MVCTVGQPLLVVCLYRMNVCLAECLSLWQLQQLRQHGRQLACAWAEPRSVVVVSGPLGVQVPGGTQLMQAQALVNG